MIDAYLLSSESAVSLWCDLLSVVSLEFVDKEVDVFVSRHHIEGDIIVAGIITSIDVYADRETIWRDYTSARVSYLVDFFKQLAYAN